jgi:muramoyltetrapeptide carboxypeptidase LdcA involved in peptidoglycan recycling
MKSVRYPEFLKENGTIGFVAPSFGCQTEPYYTGFLNAQKKLKAKGHKLLLGPNCYEGKGIGISNTPKACGEELTEFYCGGESDVLISCGGGELMCETMEHVDFERIRAAKPKWFMGFSDNTNMTFLLATLCDTAAIYGPCASQFGMEPWDESIQDAYELLRGKLQTVHGYDRWEKEGTKDEEHPLEPYQLTEKKKLRVFLPTGDEVKRAKVQMEGRLVGGCVDCLTTLLGTRFDRTREFAERYREDGIIWFLESCDLNVMGIRRAIWQMKNAGWFFHVKGFLIGRPLVFGQEMMGLDQYHAVIDLLRDYQVPIVMDADIGHLPPMMPLICGSYAHVSVRGNAITVEMEDR